MDLKKDLNIKVIIYMMNLLKKKKSKSKIYYFKQFDI